VAPSVVDGGWTQRVEGATMNRYHEQARADFDRAHRRAALGGLLARLRRRPDGLLAYREVRRGLAVAAESYRGVRAVPIDRIVGSTDRSRDFDRAFRPRRGHCAGRWVSVARAHGEGKALPPVQLYRIGDAYFVRDGHHRISVARVRGQAAIDAEVVEVLARGAPPAADAGEGRGRGGHHCTAEPGTAPGTHDRIDHAEEDTAMMPDPTVFMIARTEHELRVRAAQRAGEAEATAREGRAVPPRTPFRHRAGAALVALGHRIGGTTAPTAVGGLGRIAG
jgi:hypothetical protein